MAVHDKRIAGRLAGREFSAGLMSDTKWRILFNAVFDSDLALERFVVKFTDVDQPKVLRLVPGTLRCHYAYMDTVEFGPVELRSFEWAVFPADLTVVLERTGKKFPFEVNDGSTKIVGYRR